MHGCKITIISIFSLLCACATPMSGIPVQDKKIILRDIIDLNEARESGDINKLLSLSHSSNYEVFGSKSNYENELSNSYLRLNEIGLNVVEFRIGRMQKIFEAGGKKLVIVPRQLKLEVSSCRWMSVSYIVAIQEGSGEKWSYFFAPSLQNRDVEFRDLFPYVPENVEIPPNYVEIYRPPCAQ
uniref:hypothetical protein n=1 Tax=Microbulbifer agarilyticus TaxID=260552 RepID=UPI0002558689|nr:hypothetical protein [Microbulbifer agarilyticus]